MKTEKEIKQAAIEMMQTLINQKGYNYSTCGSWDKWLFEVGFEAGYKWALEQMKQSKENQYKNYEITIQQNGDEYIGFAWINAESVSKINDTTIVVNGLVTVQFDEPISEPIIKKP